MTKHRIAIPILVCLAAIPAAGCDKNMLAMMAKPSSDMPAGKPVKSDEGTSALYLSVVDGLLDQRRYRAALAYLDQYAVSEKASPRYLMLRGEALLGTKRYDEAKACFAELAGTSMAADAYSGIGRASAAAGDWAGAEQGFLRAVAIRPANPDFLSNLGYAQLNLGDQARQEAVFNLQQAYELKPGSASIRNNLILALFIADRDKDARLLLDSIPTPKERAEVRSFASGWMKEDAKRRSDAAAALPKARTAETAKSDPEISGADTPVSRAAEQHKPETGKKDDAT